MGFLSNKEEGAFLNSEEGQNKMSMQIANAIKSYKTEYFGEGTNSSSKKYATENVEITPKADIEVKPLLVSKDTVYSVQLFATSNKIQLDSKKFKGLQNVSSTFNNNIYRYTYGKASSIIEVNKLKMEAKKSGFPDAYIVVIKDGESSIFNDFTKQ